MPAQSRVQASRGPCPAREAFYRELDGVTIADLVNERQVGRVAVTIGLVPPSDAFA